MKTTASLAAGGTVAATLRKARAGAATAPLLAYVGTYSSPLPVVRPGQVDLPAGNGRGIHVFEVNRATGEFSPRAIFAQPTSPNCLVFNAAGTRMYATNETATNADSDAGMVSAFAVNPADGSLTLLNSVPSGGAGPTHLSLHPSGRFLFVANYFGGSVAVFPVTPDGRLKPASDVKKDAGTIGPKTAKSAPAGSFAISGHDVPHAHMILPDAAGRFVISSDLGLDQILVWKFDEQTGALSPNDPPSIALPPGDGPRHFAFHPNGRWFYSLQEEGSTVVFFHWDAEKGRLTAHQTISSLPPGFAGSNFCSEIMVSQDGNFVYAANRLHDGIAWFAVGKDGTLTFVGEEWTRGDYPRSFNFTPGGDFLYACNQRADNVTGFRVNRKTGGLTFTGQYVPVGNPSFVAFLDLAKAG